MARIEERVAAFAGVPETRCSPISVLRYGEVASENMVVVQGRAPCIRVFNGITCRRRATNLGYITTTA